MYIVTVNGITVRFASEDVAKAYARTWAKAYGYLAVTLD